MSESNIIRIGADPEMFVRRQDGTIVPGCGLFGGTKQNPIPFEDYEGGTRKNYSGEIGGYAFQEDGVALEFNIPAVTSSDRFASCIRHAKKVCRNLAASVNLTVNFSSSHTFQLEDLTDPRANAIGCSPDRDAYKEGEERNAFSAKDFGTLRFAGGHVHLGYNKSLVPPHVMAQYCDLFVGLPSLFHDHQGARRTYYGKAGLYREKDYGIEYRTLSNFWLRDNKSLYMNYMAQTLLDLGIITLGKQNMLAEAYSKIPWDDVQTAINEENTALASELHQYATAVVRLPLRYWKEMTSSSRQPKIKLTDLVDPTLDDLEGV